MGTKLEIEATNSEELIVNILQGVRSVVAEELQRQDYERAKGILINRASLRANGLTDHFIDKYEQEGKLRRISHPENLGSHWYTLGDLIKILN